MEKKKLSTTLSGVAGEYFVAAELSRRGYIASITLRNTRGVDILAANEGGTKTAQIQVKTNQYSNRFWLLNKKAESLDDPSFFYVFVALNAPEDRPSYHIVPSKIVAAHTTETHKQCKSSAIFAFSRTNSQPRFSSGFR